MLFSGGGEESRFSPAGSVRARENDPPDRFLTRAQFDSPDLVAKRKAGLSGRVFLLVEARRVELLSENKFTGPSPSAVNLLTFPPPHAGLQAYGFSSFMMHDAFKALRVHVRH